MFQKPLIKSAICFSLKVLPAALGRQVIIAQGQACRRVETSLRMIAVCPGADGQKAKQAKDSDQASDVIYIHGVLPLT
jgi:hypothetical protein